MNTNENEIELDLEFYTNEGKLKETKLNYFKRDNKLLNKIQAIMIDVLDGSKVSIPETIKFLLDMFERSDFELLMEQYYNGDQVYQASKKKSRVSQIKIFSSTLGCENDQRGLGAN